MPSGAVAPMLCGCSSCTGVLQAEQLAGIQAAGPVPAEAMITTGDVRIDSLVGSSTIRGTGPRTMNYTFGNHPFSQKLKDNYREIFNWLTHTNVINTRFLESATEVADQQMIRIETRIDGYATGGGYSVQLNLQYDYEGDLNGWQNGPGSHGYATLSHELGHALGLKHAHEGVPGVDAVQPADNHQINTLMGGANKFGAGTFMRYDILTLQYLYGAGAHNAGNTTYTFTGRIDHFPDAGLPLSADGLYGSNTAQLLWDTGGVDTLDFTGLSADATGYRFDLRPGGLQTKKTGYDAASDTNRGASVIAYGVTVENVFGSSSSDDIVLNSVKNRVGGYAAGKNVGNDIIFGATSEDTLDLGAYSRSQVTDARSGNDLVLTLGSFGSVTIKDYYAGRAMVVQFSDRTFATGNRGPVANDLEVAAVEETPVTFSLPASDPDGDALTYEIVSGPSQGKIVRTGGSVTYTPNVDFAGTDSLTYRAVANGVASTVATVVLRVRNVNDAPTLPNLTVATDPGQAIDVVLPWVDVEGNYRISSKVESQPRLGTAAVKSGTRDTVTYTPKAGFSGGTDSFTVTVRDFFGAISNVATITVNVTGPNLAPLAVDDTADKMHAGLPNSIDVLANDSDSNGDTIAITAVSKPGKGTAVVKNGKIEYAPTAGTSGSDTFTYSISDGRGGTATGRVNATIVPPPPPAPTTFEATEITRSSVAMRWSKVDGADGYILQSLQSVVDGVEKWSTFSTQGPNATGLRFVGLGEGQTGTYRIQAFTNLSGPSRNDSRFSFTTLVNRAPTATATTTTTLEDRSVEIVLAATDPDNDTITYAISVQPNHGRATLSGNRATYTPNANFHGQDTFTFTAADAKLTSIAAKVTVNVTPQNDAPVAQPGNLIVARNGSASVLLTATDVDGDPLTFSPTTMPAHGSVRFEGNRAIYTPLAGYIGPDSFAFAASDGQLKSAPQTVSILVTESGKVLVDVRPGPEAAGSGPGAVPATSAASKLAVGSGGTGGVALFDAAGSRTDFDPLPGNAGGIRVALADVNGDGVPDLVAGRGPGGPPTVVVLDGVDGREIIRFDAFESGFTGGVFVAAADLDGDGFAEIVASPDRGGGPIVALYRGQSLASGLAEATRFFGIQDDAFRGGARASLGDLTGDGVPDLVVAAGFLGGPRVTIWNGADLLAGSLERPLANFFAFEESLRNGIFVAVGDFDGDGRGELAVGGGPGGGPRYRIVDGLALTSESVGRLDDRPEIVRANGFAGDENSRGGTRLAAADLDGDGIAELIAADGEGTGGRVRVYPNPMRGDMPSPSREFDPWPGTLAGVFVG